MLDTVVKYLTQGNLYANEPDGTFILSFFNRGGQETLVEPLLDYALRLGFRTENLPVAKGRVLLTLVGMSVHSAVYRFAYV